MKSIKDEVKKTKRSYLEEFKYFGMIQCIKLFTIYHLLFYFMMDDVVVFTRFSCLGIKLKGLAEAAENYHVLLTENRKLYNEVQDLKGMHCVDLILLSC